jgi:hypothetical protein
LPQQKNPVPLIQRIFVGKMQESKEGKKIIPKIFLKKIAPKSWGFFF